MVIISSVKLRQAILILIVFMSRVIGLVSIDKRNHQTRARIFKKLIISYIYDNPALIYCLMIVHLSIYVSFLRTVVLRESLRDSGNDIREGLLDAAMPSISKLKKLNIQVNVIR